MKGGHWPSPCAGAVESMPGHSVSSLVRKSILCKESRVSVNNDFLMDLPISIYFENVAMAAQNKNVFILHRQALVER